MEIAKQWSLDLHATKMWKNALDNKKYFEVIMTDFNCILGTQCVLLQHCDFAAWYGIFLVWCLFGEKQKSKYHETYRC